MTTTTTKTKKFVGQLEANLKWNTNVLAEWLDMDLNRKRKRKHYFQYDQVAKGERESVTKREIERERARVTSVRAVQWAYESRSPCPTSSSNAILGRCSCPVRPQNANCIPNACVSQKAPKTANDGGCAMGKPAHVWARPQGGAGGARLTNWAIFLLDITINLK